MGFVESMAKSAYRRIPNPKTVTLTNATSNVTLYTARKRPITKEEMQFVANLSIDRETAMWLIDVDACGSVVPEAGSTITHGTEVWNVLHVGKELEGVVYRMPCVKQQ